MLSLCLAYIPLISGWVAGYTVRIFENKYNKYGFLLEVDF